MDALSALLRAVKLSGAMFYKSRCTAPWCLHAPPSSAFLPYVAPGATHIIEFHHISEGTAYVRVGEETTPLTAGDIVMIPHGEASAALAALGQAVEFVKDQYRHCKPILALGSGDRLLDMADIPSNLPDGDPDPGVLRIKDVEDAAPAFIDAIARHRHFDRQTDPPRV